MTTMTLDSYRPLEAVDAPPPASPRSEWMIRAARERLSPLLARAAELDLDDAPGWAQLRAAAHATTSVLCAADVLPPHVRVRHGDPPVVIARTIAAAWRLVGTP